MRTYATFQEYEKMLLTMIAKASRCYHRKRRQHECKRAWHRRLKNVGIAEQGAAGKSIARIKDAVNTVSSTRGDLGAIQNRLEHTINNLSVTTENMTAAESRIRDTDMAEEMMSYTKNNILVQASQAMLAQANQVPQGVLQLLQ